MPVLTGARRPSATLKLVPKPGRKPGATKTMRPGTAPRVETGRAGS